MVLSSQTTMGMARHHDQTDVAACWGNLAGAAAIGAEGWNSPLLPNPETGKLGDTETGHEVTRATLPFLNVLKDMGGRWERCNLIPTGGRQHRRMSSNGRTQGDDLSRRGAVVLGGASSQDRRIAQASNGDQYGCCGVFRLRSEGVSGQNLGDSSGPSRDVDSVGEGKPRVRNICGAKGLRTDCTANRSHMLIGLHHRASGQKEWLTWEVPCSTSTPLVQGRRQGMGEAVSRFKQVEQWLHCKPCGLVSGLGRKRPSVEGWTARPAGKFCEDLRHAMPSTRTLRVGPQNVARAKQGDSFSPCGQVANQRKGQAPAKQSIRSASQVIEAAAATPQKRERSSSDWCGLTPPMFSPEGAGQPIHSRMR